MSKDSFLMCPPTYYKVAYEINPWMHKDDWMQSDYNMAQVQWGELLRAITSRGYKVDLMTPHPDFPDMVFTANAGFWYRNNFNTSKFLHEQRQGESELYCKKFNSGYSTSETFEGAGDLIRDDYREINWCGYGFRTSENAAESFTVASWIRDGVDIGHYEYPDALKLIDPRFYHLDTCFLPLPDGEVMFYSGAFDEASLKKIKDKVKPKHRLPISQEEALMFCANAIVLGENIIMSQSTYRLRNELSLLGYEVIEVNLSAFHKAGGSAACLVLRKPAKVF